MNRRALFATTALFACAACGKPTDEFTRPDVVECDPDAAVPDVVRVASFNIQATKSAPIERVGDVLEDLDADVVALQEVHKNIPWTGDVDQGRVLADRLGYQLAYAATLEKAGGSQGVALLSRLPFHDLERIDLQAPLQMEPRVAIDARVCAGPTPMRVVATHNDVLPWSGEDQAKDLLAATQDSIGEGIIVAGDFNALPTWAGPLALVAAGFVDLIAQHGEVSSFIGDFMPRRLDFLFADDVVAQRVHATGMLEEKASDHYPIWADVSAR